MLHLYWWSCNFALAGSMYSRHARFTVPCVLTFMRDTIFPLNCYKDNWIPDLVNYPLASIAQVFATFLNVSTELFQRYKSWFWFYQILQKNIVIPFFSFNILFIFYLVLIFVYFFLTFSESFCNFLFFFNYWSLIWFFWGFFYFLLVIYNEINFVK